MQPWQNHGHGRNQNSGQKQCAQGERPAFGERKHDGNDHINDWVDERPVEQNHLPFFKSGLHGRKGRLPFSFTRVKRHKHLFGILALAALAACRPEPQPQPWNSLTDVVDPEDLLLYEVNPRAHSAAGTIAGITADLDRIKSLNVNTIWLMPVFKMGQLKSVGSPYCVADYRAIDPEFGTLDDLKSLIAEAHEREISVIIDWVANHTAWDHPWITQHPEWYTTNAAGTIVHPPGTNWQDVADLNFANPALQLAMIDEMKYWVFEVGIDGFRYDAADYVPFAFWKSAMDNLKGITDRKLLFLTGGERPDRAGARPRGRGRAGRRSDRLRAPRRRSGADARRTLARSARGVGCDRGCGGRRRPQVLGSAAARRYAAASWRARLVSIAAATPCG